MKRVKKNQVIITALAIMIAVAGYINYAGNISDIISVSSKSGSKVVNTSTDDTIFTEEEPDDESLEEPGSVILTSGQGVSSSVISEAKLNREQIRAKNTENLTNIVNDTTIDKASKTEGFNDVVASVAEDSVDIVINQQTLENSQKAQIEDIAKRKTGVTSDKITINVIK